MSERVVWEPGVPLYAHPNYRRHGECPRRMCSVVAETFDIHSTKFWCSRCWVGWNQDAKHRSKCWSCDEWATRHMSLRYAPIQVS